MEAKIYTVTKYIYGTIIHYYMLTVYDLNVS